MTTLDGVVLRLSWLCSAFAEELGSKPTFAEFLEILGSSVPSNSEFIEAVPFPLRFKATTRGDRRYEGPPSTRVAELNDNTFGEAADFLAFLAEQIGAVSGRAASADELAKQILRVVHAGKLEFEDISGKDVVALTADVPKHVAKAKVGDVLAIPVQGGHRLASVVARNHFGTAIGLQGVFPDPRLGGVHQRSAGHRPIYTDDHQVANGTWSIVGHDDALLSQFPTEPEIYHGPDVLPGPRLGEFGAAESPGGASYTAVTSSTPTTLYRVYGGSAGELGRFWTRTRPTGPIQSTVDDALDPAWGNTATNWVQVEVPAGTTFYEGATAAQRGLVGGGNQVYLPNVDPAWVVGRGAF